MADERRNICVMPAKQHGFRAPIRVCVQSSNWQNVHASIDRFASRLYTSNACPSGSPQCRSAADFHEGRGAQASHGREQVRGPAARSMGALRKVQSCHFCGSRSREKLPAMFVLKVHRHSLTCKVEQHLPLPLPVRPLPSFPACLRTSCHFRWGETCDQQDLLAALRCVHVRMSCTPQNCTAFRQ